MKIDPIHQFNIEPSSRSAISATTTIAFTNSSLYMFAAVGAVSLLMIGGIAGKQLIPDRLQSIAEISYEFVANTIRSTAGAEGHEVLPAGLLAVHVHLRREPDRHHPLHLHGHEPHHRHRGAGADRLLDGDDLRLLQERPQVLQAFRAVTAFRSTSCRWSCSSRCCRSSSRPVSHSGASVRQHAGRPHRAEGVRGLRRDARRLARCRRLDRRASCRWR